LEELKDPRWHALVKVLQEIRDELKCLNENLKSRNCGDNSEKVL